MGIIGNYQYRILHNHIAGLLTLALLLVMAHQAAGAAPASKGWELERYVEEPSYALIEPTESNLNIDVLVLTCAAAGNTSILQLQIYLSTEGPLTPEGIEPSQLRPDPRALIRIDGRSFPVTMFFADDYVLIADTITDRVPSLSTSLIDAMQNGRGMTMRFDLVSKVPGRPAGFDGEATFDLQAGGGGAAVAAVRHCTLPGTIGVLG